MTQWFPETIGHDGAKEALRRGVQSGRLNGSILFCGPSGSGRSLLARELAQAVNCEAEGAARMPCGGCTPCRKIKSGVCGDYLVLQPTDKPSIGIDQVRGLLDELALAPVECRRRVFLIDPASALKEEAQNALLKGLEEPPARTLIILLAEHEHELLSTIVSRCRVLRLQELKLAQVEGILRRTGLDAKEASERARWSSGSPGLALADDALEVAEAAARTLDDFAGGAAYDDPMETVDRLIAFSAAVKSDTAEAKRQRIAKAVRIIVRALRDAMLEREGGFAEGGGFALSGVDGGITKRLARLPRGRLETAVDMISQVEEELTRNANTKFVLDGLVLDVGAVLVPRVASAGADREAIAVAGKAGGVSSNVGIVTSDERSQRRRGRASRAGNCDERHEVP